MEQNLWEEKKLIEQKKNCLKCKELGQKDITKIIESFSIQNLCKDIGKSVIYKIVNKINGKFYVGCSNKFFGSNGRLYQHIYDLTRNKHVNKKLQNSWNKYGFCNFSIYIEKYLGDLDSIDLLKHEQIYLNGLIDCKNICFNLTFKSGGGNLGQYVNSKISNSLKGRFKGIDNNWYGKGKFQTGDKNPFYGKKHSDDSRELMSIKKKKLGKFLGKNNPKFDESVYIFINKETLEEFVGQRIDFCLKFNVDTKSLYNVIKGHRKSHKGWMIKMIDNQSV